MSLQFPAGNCIIFIKSVSLCNILHFQFSSKIKYLLNNQFLINYVVTYIQGVFPLCDVFFEVILWMQVLNLQPFDCQWQHIGVVRSHAAHLSGPGFDSGQN